MLPRQRVETVAHAIELLSFVQERIGVHGYAAFAECLKRENSDGLPSFREPEARSRFRHNGAEEVPLRTVVSVSTHLIRHLTLRFVVR
jgi:hypothetical protein